MQIDSSSHGFRKPQFELLCWCFFLATKFGIESAAGMSGTLRSPLNALVVLAVLRIFEGIVHQSIDLKLQVLYIFKMLLYL